MKLEPSPEIEEYRDRLWRRDPERRVDNVFDAERFVDEIGFCTTLTDSRHSGPSLYIAVCGRRDVHAPRNVQKDPEMNLAWHIKDDLLRRGNVYYAKLAKGKAMLISRCLVPYFKTIWGIKKSEEAKRLSAPARKVLAILRREWEMATADLRMEAKFTDRKSVTAALDELQRAMLVLPGEVLYDPWFTYIWTLAQSRFPDEFRARIAGKEAFLAIARALLRSKGQTELGELSRLTGLSRSQCGLANHYLVDEGFAWRTDTGIYRLADLGL